MNPILVFAGPSLPGAHRPDGPFDWRPPARAGDLMRLLDDPPDRLCLIDGFFDWCPAPWHKELLLLMSRGTAVFGAASMGALRAAELHTFGMRGIGVIFQAYRDGRLAGDDEVALIHATDELDWAPLSVPMVELRATLVAGCRTRRLLPDAARAIRALAREIHFEDRDWPAIVKASLESDVVDADTLADLRALHVPLKRLDALACLQAALSWRPPPRPAPPPATCFLSDLARSLGL